MKCLNSILLKKPYRKPISDFSKSQEYTIPDKKVYTLKTKSIYSHTPVSFPLIQTVYN